MRPEQPIEFDNNDPTCRTPVLCNKYAIDIPDSVLDEKRGNHHPSQSLAVNTHNNRYGSSSRGRNDTVNRKCEPPQRPSPSPPPPPNRYNRFSPEEEFDLHPIRKNRRREKYGNIHLDILFCFIFSCICSTRDEILQFNFVLKCHHPILHQE